MTKKELTRRQARWANFLASFDFIINFRAGKLSGKPDALSRRPDHKPDVEPEKFGAILNRSHFACISAATIVPSDSALVARIKELTPGDLGLTSIIAYLKGRPQLAPSHL